MKELLQQALDALLEYDYAKTDKADRLGEAAIYALRLAIAQPEQPAVLKRVTIADALDYLNTNDKAFWATGWNDCIESIQAAPVSLWVA